MAEKYDFYAIGQKYATDEFADLKKMAESYKKHYGEQAKEDFEMGIISVMPEYAKVSEMLTRGNDKLTERILAGKVGGTKDFGKPGEVNQSYFDNNRGSR